ncbi:MAG: hypothetical protein C4295_08800 [Candidatus Fervidibacterota bacterium]
MRTERVRQLPSVPTETGRIHKVQGRKGKGPQKEQPMPPHPALKPAEDTEDEKEQTPHLDTLA